MQQTCMINPEVVQSGEYLKAALGYMGRFNIPVTPQNYSVWFEYVTEKNRELAAAIDGCIVQGGKFTPENNRRLYRNFIERKKEDRSELHYLEFRQILLELLRMLADNCSNIAASQNNLSQHIRQLEEEKNPEEIRAIVRKVVADTGSLLNATRNLNENVKGRAVAIQKLREDLAREKKLASMDGLTSVANRRAFEEELERQIHAVRSAGDPLSLVFVDIDHFKKINDNFGHITGDTVLKVIARMISRSIEKTAFLARYGGEEFVILLPRMDVEGAMCLAEKTRERLERYEWRKKDTGEVLGRITASMGVAQYACPESGEEFVKRADEALYRSKQEGRNRVSLAASCIQSHCQTG